MSKLRAAAVAVTALLALGTTACSTIELDSRGRWVGGAEVMTTWADTHVPASWERIDQSVVYGDIIDDFGHDTRRDQTTFSAHYRNVSKRQFAAFGSGPLELDQRMECEPADPEKAEDTPSPAVTNCFLSLYQGQDPLPDEFDLFATWTLYADHTTRVDLYLTNAPD
jgi:hypothetical protein